LPTRPSLTDVEDIEKTRGKNERLAKLRAKADDLKGRALAGVEKRREDLVGKTPGLLGKISNA